MTITCYRCNSPLTPEECGCRDRQSIIHGDCLAVLPMLSENSIDYIITDPPYSSGGQFRGDRLGRTTDKYQRSDSMRDYEEFSGDNRDQRAFGYWCSLWLMACLQTAKPGCVVGIFSDWRQLPTISDVLQSGGWVWRGIVPWDKTEAARPAKGRYRNQCEYLVWGSSGGMERDGPCLPGYFRCLADANRLHLAGKPLSLMRALVKIAWRPEAVVLDPFMGSGTTLLATRDAGRRGIGIEIEERYCEIAANRLRQGVLNFDD